MMSAMEGLVKLFNMWEIQLLVLLSFAVQFFLFFTGILRQHSANKFLRISIWGAYLGADFVAVYTLGLVSRHEDVTIEGHITGNMQPLAFMWAPFLLVHLGGQDTITAFAMEDNNLWKRHLLNLVVQAILVIYVFWKSIGRHNLEILLSGVFLFVVGVIKYGERIWSLKCGCFTSLENSAGQRYKKLSDLHTRVSTGCGYDSIVCTALGSMPRVHDIFSGRSKIISAERFHSSLLDDNRKVIKMVNVILSMMYADLYTKALVVRTRSAIVLRCISQMSAVVAFAVFHANDKQRYYSKVDIAITYSLFVGGFFLEVCAVFISLMSPWTWAWLKVRKWDKVAMLSWFIISSDIGWPEEKQCWLKSMGQYNFSNWVTGSGQARTFNQRVMTIVKWFANFVRVQKKKIFWMSKLLDVEYVHVDEITMEFVAKEIIHMTGEGSFKGNSIWSEMFGKLGDFSSAVVFLHVLTEKHLSRYATCGEVGMMEVRRKLSHYMMYLLATQPSMLPLNVSAEAMLDMLQDGSYEDLVETMLDKLQYHGIEDETREVLEVELVHVWARLLIYAAGKSRGEMHMALLSREGEFITFVWLLMALHDLGDSEVTRIRLTNDVKPRDCMLDEIYAFPVPAAPQPEEATSISIPVEVIDG